jgi:PAS domain S-box-containing protein
VGIFRKKKSATQPNDNLDGQAMNALADSAALLNTISDGVAVITQDGIVRAFNTAATALTGWAAGEAIDLDFRSIFKLSDAHSRPLDNSLSPITSTIVTHQQLSRDDLFLTSNDDKRFPICISVTPLDQKSGGVIVVFRDITGDKHIESEHNDFVSTASHEMRTPLAVIEGYIGMLLNPKLATLDSRGLQYAQKAHESAQHLGRLFQDLLDVSKTDDGRMSMNPTLIDSGATARQIVEEFQSAATSKNLTLKYDATGVQPLYVIYADLDHLKEILQNLIENALKYTKAGGVSVKVSGDDSRVHFSVADSGIGIPAEDVPHLFQKFYRVDSSDTREIGGTGLGLYLTKKLTEMMGGQIGLSSDYGQGSTFWVEFPRLNRDQVVAKINQIKAARASGTPLPPTAPADAQPESLQPNKTQV